MAALEQASYEELIPPTLEYQDTFLRAGGPDVAERLIRFPDRDGRILALRYDFTASLARVAATTFAQRRRPLRLCYSGTVYRQEPERGGRPREMLQVGAELLGQGDLAADIEVVRLTIALVRAAGLQDFQVNLGHVGVLAPGIAALAEDAARRRAPLDRPQGPRQSLPGAASATGDAGTLRRCRSSSAGARRSRARWPVPRAARPGLEHLLALDAALTADERTHVVYDLGEVRGLEYYTGVHFEVFVAGAGRAAGAGGRYDDLMGRFGRPMPAVGVSLDLDTIAEVAP